MASTTEHQFYCIKCGKEKPGGLFLPPGPIDYDEIKRNRH